MPTINALIFAKYPLPGTVKTRLTPTLSPPQASALHKASLCAVVERIGCVPELELVLVAAPDERLNDFRSFLEVGAIWPQGDGNLGHRLDRAVNRAFDAGASGVMLFGADSPALPVSAVHEAVKVLSSGRAAVGPCDDGGYYLLALPGRYPALFDDVRWGTPDVLDQTRQTAKRIGLALHELAPSYDVDRPDDLGRTLSDLRAIADQSGPACHALAAMLESLVPR